MAIPLVCQSGVLGVVQQDGADGTVGKALGSLRDLEQQAQGRLRAAGHDTQKFVHENPWMVIAATTMAAYAIGLLTRSRH